MTFLGVILISAGIYFFALPISGTAGVHFEIKNGISSMEIASNLEKQNLIRSKWAFLAILKLERKTIKAGVYEFSPPFHVFTIFSKLSKGEVDETVVTFPEGFSIKDMAGRLEEKGVIKKEDFLKEVSNVSKYQKDYPFLADLTNPNLEGYLFPDTYHFSYGITSEEIVKKMLDNFKKKTEGLNVDTKILILASIVEREAKKSDERPKIASVYLNRLNQNMKLEADPTVQYAKGSWDKIKLEDYKIDSPYNTYKYAGLPPGPICNPGLDSIMAILNPEKTDYLYFFHTKDDQTIFSVTAQEHETRRKEYSK